MSPFLRRFFANSVVALLLVSMTGCGTEKDSASESATLNSGSATGAQSSKAKQSSSIGVKPATASSKPPAGYPYATWQGNQRNCVPRAFECHTGAYDPKLMGGPRDQDGNLSQWIDSSGRTFYGRGPGQLPAPGDVVYYDYDQQTAGTQGHAGVCTGYTADGRCIIATGHANAPYHTRLPGELDQTYTPATPIR